MKQAALEEDFTTAMEMKKQLQSIELLPIDVLLSCAVE
jgi:hypothetical protein